MSAGLHDMSPKVCTPLLWVLLLIASFTARTIECISDSVYNSTFDTGISFANNTAIFRQWDQQSSAVVQLKFGKLQEIDSEGVVVASHYIPALYALQPKYTSGVCRITNFQLSVVCNVFVFPHDSSKLTKSCPHLRSYHCHQHRHYEYELVYQLMIECSMC